MLSFLLCILFRGSSLESVHVYIIFSLSLLHGTPSLSCHSVCFTLPLPPPPSVAVQPEADTNPCVPDPCGANAQCRVQGTVAVCECRPGTFGNPNQPSGCRYECVANADCPMDSACINRRCVDPCVGTCGLEALCDVVAHNPICRCPAGYTGDPIYRCTLSKPLPLPCTLSLSPVCLVCIYVYRFLLHFVHTVHELVQCRQV